MIWDALWIGKNGGVAELEALKNPSVDEHAHQEARAVLVHDFRLSMPICQTLFDLDFIALIDAKRQPA